MITLNGAAENAKLLDKDIPSYSTLGNWVSKGLISSVAEKINKGKAGGVIGLYPDSIVAEIITAQRLKKDYKLADIAATRTELLEEKDFRKLSQQEFDKFNFKVLAENQTNKKYKIMQDKMQRGANQEELNEAIKNYQRAVELEKTKKDYLKVYVKIKF